MLADQIRRSNAQVADMYDLSPWGHSGVPWLKFDWLLGVSRLYGIGQSVHDVLDLGCGAGGALAQIADQTPGRLVGVDISPRSCDLARENLASLGARAEIHCADLLDLNPDDLGEFDLIYLIGVFYVTPAEVQAKLLSIVDRCLRPGGLCVVSYYSGTTALVRASLYRMIRSICGDAGRPNENLIRARQILETLRAGLTEGGSFDAVAAQAIDEITDMPDATLFHEAFNPFFEASQTSDLARRFGDRGLQFLSRIDPSPASFPALAVDRAFLEDQGSLTRPGYRHAIFGRRSNDGAPDPTAAGIQWLSTLVRASNVPETDGTATFIRASDNLKVTARHAFTQTLLDQLESSPRSWADAFIRAVKASGAAPTAEMQANAVQDFYELWRLGAIKPLAV